MHNMSGRSPLMWAATAAEGLPVVHALLEAGASPTTKDDDGASALNWALERGRRDILSVIAKYEYGADTELLETSGI